ncbi:hypothetical protein [Sigmofec virus UA08Rod_6752]|uniref:Uncharacterized protein n=1 Tax=Sigmofec virus UA08Rod_6752 TaxID=2929239 RepID=A0A976N0X0_9VIRU|nr:hypothetical protein [Sigmofec virus UA08Rod_6752]
MSKLDEKIAKLTNDVYSIISFIPVVRELFCCVAGLCLGIIKAVKDPTGTDISRFVLDNKKANLKKKGDL